MNTIPTLNMIWDAATTLRGVARQTPVIPFGRMGDRLFIKAENLQITGSFKIRGAYNKLSSLNAEEASKGIIACSAGNHAQGVAFSAMRLGMRAVICMPDYAPALKVEGTRSYGAEVVLVPGNYDDSAREAERLSAEKGYTFAHPFNDPFVIAGQRPGNPHAVAGCTAGRGSGRRRRPGQRGRYSRQVAQAPGEGDRCSDTECAFHVCVARIR